MSVISQLNYRFHEDLQGVSKRSSGTMFSLPLTTSWSKASLSASTEDEDEDDANDELESRIVKE